jgi:DNA-binding NarL/FixJ family response regulator
MKLVIVEDDILFTENLLQILKKKSQITVEGVFPNAEDALVYLKDDPPDILLADLGLPGISGVELISRAKEILPELEAMVITVFEDRDMIVAALKAGASSYILKSDVPDNLVSALFELEQGGSPMSPRIARKVVKEFQVESIEEQYLLSGREKSIIKAIERGLSYKEISNDFHISIHTVHAHIRNIYKKLQASDRHSAVVAARKKGII